MGYKNAPRKKKEAYLKAARAVAVSIACHSKRCEKVSHWVFGSVDDLKVCEKMDWCMWLCRSY